MIVSSVTETAEEVRKLHGKEDSLREISQKDRSPRGKPGSESSESGLKERNLEEIDPRQSLQEYREASTTESAVSPFGSQTVGAFTPFLLNVA